jgi:hypothetical protein
VSGLLNGRYDTEGWCRKNIARTVAAVNRCERRN